MSFFTPKGMLTNRNEDHFAEEHVPFFSSAKRTQGGLQGQTENNENTEDDKNSEFESNKHHAVKQEMEPEFPVWKSESKNFSKGLNLDLDLINDSYFEFRK